MVSKKETNEIAGAGASNRFVPDNAVASRGAIQDTSPEIVPIDDPVQLFKAAVDTGVVNTQAQIVNFKGSLAAIMGNEEKAESALNQAQLIQQAGAPYLAGAETFEEFLDQPTFGGFINQAIQATGQFVPSAVASIGLAMTGAGAGAAITAGVSRKVGTKALQKTILPQSVAKEAYTKREVQKVVNKFIALEANKVKKRPTKLDPLTPDEETLIKNLYASVRNKRLRRGATVGALTGAGSQEQVMGQGIAFGDFGEQGMIDQEAGFQSALQGLGFAAIGLGSEVAVAKSVANVLKRKQPKGINTAKDAPIRSKRARIAQVAATTSVAEGLAEAGQEELSVQQKFRIDEEYTKTMANLDRANALFAGFFGGLGVGTAIGTPSAVAGKMYDQAKQAHEIAFTTEMQDLDKAGTVLAESEADIRKQFADMDSPTIRRDLVYVVNANAETMETLEPEMLAKYPNVQAVEIADVGTIYTNNPEVAEAFANVMSANVRDKNLLDEWLASNLGYTRPRRSEDTLAVRVKDEDGSTRWEQSTSVEGEAQAIAAAEAYINKTPGLTVETRDLESVVEERMDAMQDEGLDEEELGNIFALTPEPTAVEEGRGSFLDPITPRQKGTQVWAIPSTDITYDQALVEEARTLVPTEFEREFDQDISKKRYSESLLKAFIRENVNDTTGAFYKINENTERGGFNLIKYNMGYTPGVTQPSPADITKVVNRAKRNARNSRFTIETPEMDKPVGIDMPTLVNQGRVLARRFGESLSQDEFGSAIDGFAFILGSLEGNYALFYDGKLVNSETFNDPGAIVYTKNKGRERFTLNDLQRGRESQVKSGDLEAGFDPRQDIQEESRLETVETGQGVDLETGRQTPQFVQVEDQTTLPDQRIEDEFNQRLFKNPYAKGSTRAAGPKPGVSFTSVVEQHLDATFLTDFQRIANTKLGLKKAYKVFSTTEDITLESLEGDADLLTRVQAALTQDMGPEGSTRGRNIKGANFDVLLVQTREGLNKAEQGARAFVVAHEIGHSFVNQELEKSLSIPKLRQGLLNAFNQDREGNDTAQYTNDDQGFNEWMSDQVASYLLDETKKAQNQTDSFFKRLAGKIQAFVKEFSNFATRRYGVSPAFADYVVELKRINNDPGHFMTKYLASAEIQQTVEKIGKEIPLGDPKAPQKIQQTVNRLKETGNLVGVGEFLKVVLFAKDNLLRGYGPAGKKLAQMFRGQSQTTEEVGLLTATVTQARAKMNEIQDILGVFKTGDMTQDKMNILLDAESSKPTEELGPQAQRIREWLVEHYDKLNLQEIGVDRLSNFFPRSLAIQEIAGDKSKAEALANLLIEYNPGLTKAEADLSVEITLSDATNEIELAALKQAEKMGTVEETLKELRKQRNIPSHARYSLGLTKARVKLYSRIPTEALRNIEVLEDPHRALQKYIDNTVKKVELNKRGGPQQIEKLLSEIQDPKQREQATKTVMAMLGKVEPISSGLFRGANQIGLAFNVTTLLTFATFASFPDLAGPILRSKDFGALRTAASTIFNMINNKEEAAQLAKDIGVVGIDAMMETFVGAGELDYTSENTKKFTNKFFRGIGLEQFTRFTRIFAAGMGKAFLLDNGKKAAAGNQRSIRYLKELGLTAEEVNNWAGGNINEAGNEKIKLALARFVDESIVRPNAAERPTWASDPRFALVWQLKSFFYAYGKTIVGGSMNEMQARYTEAGLTGAAIPLFLGAATLLPLTMLGFDLRERFKVGLAWLLPGVSPEDKNYRRSQTMDWGEYSTEIIDRSGVLGPFTLALPLFMEDRRYGDPMWVGPLGPTVEKGYDLFTGDLRLKDLTPLYNNL